MFLVLHLFWPWRPKRSSDVTMFQRSSTYIMSVKHGVTRVFGGSFVSFYETNLESEDRLELGLYFEGGPPPDVADRINASFPNYLQKPLHQRIVLDIANDDKSVHENFPDSSPTTF